MKKIFFIFILFVLILCGCGEQEDLSITDENPELIETEYIDGFEKADYDKFNSYAYENGLDGTLIYIEGIVLNEVHIDSKIDWDAGIIVLTIEQSDGNRWTVGMPIAFADEENIIKDILDKKVRIFGTYGGYSDLFNLPSMLLAVDDLDIMHKARIEVEEKGEYTTIWSYSDYIENGIKYLDNNQVENESISSEEAEEITEEDDSESQESKEENEAITTDMRNALASAKQYLNFTSFSYDGLIAQLEYEKYTYEESVYAADHCGADWNEQALNCAKKYLSFSAFSYSGLMKQLEYEKFTSEQARYAVDNCGADWNEQAAKSAKNYLIIMSFSKEELIEQLEYEGFTHEQAVYGAESNGY